MSKNTKLILSGPLLLTLSFGCSGGKMKKEVIEDNKYFLKVEPKTDQVDLDLFQAKRDAKKNAVKESIFKELNIGEKKRSIATKENKIKIEIKEEEKRSPNRDKNKEEKKILKKNSNSFKKLFKEIKDEVVSRDKINKNSRRGTRRPQKVAEKPQQMGIYRVKGENETLMLVAFNLYGNYLKWRDLAKLNEGMLGQDYLLREGMLLKYPIPEKTFKWNPKGLPFLIRRGHTLGKISDEVYLTHKKWKKIWKNNLPLIRDPDKIFAGFSLFWIPDPAIEKLKKKSEEKGRSLAEIKKVKLKVKFEKRKEEKAIEPSHSTKNKFAKEIDSMEFIDD